MRLIRPGFSILARRSMTRNPWVIFVSKAGDTDFAGILQGTAGKTVTIDWGDGTKENLTFSGGDDNISHDYGTTGNFIISLTGDLGDLAKIHYPAQKLSRFYLPSILGKLNYLIFEGTSVSGNISDLKIFTTLTYLNLGWTNMTGDIADIDTLTNITFLRLCASHFTYSTMVIPDSWTKIEVYDLGWNSATVDQFIIDLDTPGRVANGTLNIAGNNAARTHASDTAKANLEAKGWVITANEPA